MLGLDFETKLVVRDKGARRIRKEIEKMGHGVSFTSGIHKEQGKKLPTYHGKVDGQIPVGVYANWQEFGLRRTKVGDIPARPFLWSTFDSKRASFLKHTAVGIKNVHRGTMSVEQLLDTQGKRMQKWIQQRIITLRDPPNAPLTLYIKRLKKRGSNPLVFSRSMHDSIRSETKYPAWRKYYKLTRWAKKLRKTLEKLDR